MNRQFFLQLLEHPDSVSEQENIALQKFTEDFPYCQTGRLLFVKHLHTQQSVHYPEQLKVAAAYAADRKMLYNLIHLASPLAPLQRRGEYSEEDVMQIPSVIEEKKVAEVSDEQIRQPESFILTEEPAEKSSSVTHDQIIPEKKIEEKESRDQSDIIQKRLQEISSRKITPTVPEAHQEKKEELKSEPIQLREKPTISSPEIIQTKIREEKKEEDTKSGKHSFTGWLKTVKKEPLDKSKEEKKPVPSTEEIINRFIETEPRIVPSKAEFYNPIKMAKQSLEEHDDLVSETLAGVFAEQGNLPRAIEMYRKLMLSYPEKSSFFAARIEKLTQQLNEGK